MKAAVRLISSWAVTSVSWSTGCSATGPRLLAGASSVGGDANDNDSLKDQRTGGPFCRALDVAYGRGGMRAGRPCRSEHRVDEQTERPRNAMRTGAVDQARGFWRRIGQAVEHWFSGQVLL